MLTHSLVSILLLSYVLSRGNHTILKYISRGKKISDKTETGQDYMDAFDELTRGFELIEERNKMKMTPYERKPSRPGGQSLLAKGVANIEKKRRPKEIKNSNNFSKKIDSPNNNLKQNSKVCIENYFNIWSQDRIGPEEVSDIKSDSECSRKCSERLSCNHWIWHKETAGRFAHQCVTITGFREKRRDGNTVFGDRGCLAGK